MTEISGDLIAEDLSGCDSLAFPNLTEVGGDVTITNTDAGDISLNSLNSTGGNIDINDNASAGDIDLSSLNSTGGNIDINDNASAGDISLNSLNSTGGNIDINDNASAGDIDLSSLNSPGGNIDINDNASAGDIDLSSLNSTGGNIDIEDNGGGTPTVTLGSLTDVDGNLTVETEGAGTFDPGPVSPGGNTNLTTEGYDAVTATTAAGDTSVQNERAEATMRAELPAGTFTTPVEFTLTRLDPTALPPENGTGAGGGAAVVDPVAAYEFGFAVPTLNQDATLSFDVQVDDLDPATRADFLAALDAGTATLVTKGDGPTDSYQAFPLCAGTQVPTADGCVAVEKLDANGQPTTGTPAVVRFSGVTGHFSTWAVAIVESQPVLKISARGRVQTAQGPLILFSAANDCTPSQSTGRASSRAPPAPASGRRARSPPRAARTRPPHRGWASTLRPAPQPAPSVPPPPGG